MPLRDARRADQRPPQRRHAPARRAWAPTRCGRRSATARRRTPPRRPGAARAGTRGRRAPGRAGGAAPRGRRRGRTSRPRRAARTPRRPRSPPPGRARRRTPTARASMPGRDVRGDRRADHPGAQQVEREVAGAGADLERAVEAAARAAAAPAPCAACRVTCAWPDLVVADAPLRVVVLGGEVVVADVGVADGRRRSAWPQETRSPPYLDSPGRCTRPSSSSQPEGVPPLELTGERTLPDVPAENYWFRRHLAVYEWIAERCAGLDVVDMACGEGYGTDVLAAARAAASPASTPTPTPTSTPAPSTAAPGVRFVRDLIETYIEPLRRRRVPADDRARQGAAAGARPLQGDGDDRLRLHPQPAHARAARRRQVGQPLAPARVPRARSSARSARASSTGRAARRSSTRASCARTSWRCARAGTACTRALGITKPFYDRFTPAISARDFALRPGPLDRRAGLRRGAALSAATPGALALVLHSHMPYVEGFGTWPFGEEWLWEAVACVYLPLLDLLDGAPVTRRPDAGAVRPARGDARRARRALPALPARGPRADPRRGRATGWSAPASPAGRRGAPRGRRLRVRRAGLRAPRPRPAERVRRARAGGAVDVRRDPRAAAAAGHRRRAAAPARHRHGLAPAPLRRLGRRLLAARVRLRARVGARPRRPRRARLLRRPDRGARLRPPAPGGDRRRARSPCRSTGRPSSWSGTTATATRPTAPTATTTGARVHDLKPWDNDGRPVRPRGRRGRWPATTRATSWSARARRRGRRRPALLRARHRAARPLVVRGAGLARGGARGGAAPGPRAGHGERGASSGSSPSGPRSRPSTWGSGKDLSTWDSPDVGHMAVAARRARAAHRGRHGRPRAPARRRWSVPRASCWRCRRATGPSWPRASWRATTRASACDGHRADLDAALDALADSAAVPEPAVAQPGARPRPRRAHLALMRAR